MNPNISSPVLAAEYHVFKGCLVQVVQGLVLPELSPLTAKTLPVPRAGGAVSHLGSTVLQSDKVVLLRKPYFVVAATSSPCTHRVCISDPTVIPGAPESAQP